MNRSGYLTTGELAKFMHVTKNTLFHYDQIGLFSPELKLENDYRYYGIHQLIVLDNILVLKDLGMSLSEIKEFLDNRSQAQLLQLLDTEEDLIEAQIKKLKDRKKWIHNCRSSLLNIQTHDLSKIYRESFEKKYYVQSAIKEGTEQEVAMTVNHLVASYEQQNDSMCYEIGYLQYDEDISQQIYDHYQNVVLLMDQKPKGLPYQILEAGDHLVAYHIGDWRKIGSAYQRLLSYASDHHICLDSQFIEAYLVDNLAEKEESNFVTRIRARILSD